MSKQKIMYIFLTSPIVFSSTVIPTLAKDEVTDTLENQLFSSVDKYNVSTKKSTSIKVV